MKTNPADAIKDAMWYFLMTGSQKSNVPALKENVYDLIRMTTQKTAGQRRDKKKDIDWGTLDMVLMRIVVEATALVLSGDLDRLEGVDDTGGDEMVPEPHTPTGIPASVSGARNGTGTG